MSKDKVTSVELLDLVKYWAAEGMLKEDSLARALETVSKTQEVEYFQALHAQHHAHTTSPANVALNNLLRGNFGGEGEPN